MSEERELRWLWALAIALPEDMCESVRNGALAELDAERDRSLRAALVAVKEACEQRGDYTGHAVQAIERLLEETKGDDDAS